MNMIRYALCMGTCELCGNEKVSTRKTRTLSTIVDCCNRCLLSLGLEPINDGSNFKKETYIKKNKQKIIKTSLIGTEIEELIPNFHVKIREERENRGWSIEELAKKVNERVKILQKMENGNRVTDTTIKKISKALNIKLYSTIMPQNDRVIKSKENKEMTMADANISQIDNRTNHKNIKKKKRKLGVSRSGGRKRKKE